jgi:hypothetical protein
VQIGPEVGKRGNTGVKKKLLPPPLPWSFKFLCLLGPGGVLGRPPPCRRSAQDRLLALQPSEIDGACVWSGCSPLETGRG